MPQLFRCSIIAMDRKSDYQQSGKFNKLSIDEDRMFEINCSAQNNQWGKRGVNSMVAQLLSSADPNFQIDSNQHYAELWMGTHPTSPSTLNINGRIETLPDWLKRNPSCIGSGSNSCSDGQLPFLMKVLSIEKSLAVQVHPDKITAERLHKAEPSVYTDSNHKPEMAVALTTFKALCGFRSVKEVANFIKNIGPLRRAIGPDYSNLLNASDSSELNICIKAMRDCFRALLKQSKDVIALEIAALLQEICTLESLGKDATMFLPEIVRKLSIEYPGDVGVFVVYFMNVIDLDPGDAIFIDSNVPHAYLSGDCIECMACSHNVIRAALSNKLCDVEAFCQTANFLELQTDHIKLQPTLFQQKFEVSEFLYDARVQDFTLSLLKATGGTDISIRPLNSSSICLILTGLGEAVSSTNNISIKLKPGTVLFIVTDEIVTIKLHSINMVIYRAFCTY